MVVLITISGISLQSQFGLYQLDQKSLYFRSLVNSQPPAVLIHDPPLIFRQNYEDTTGSDVSLSVIKTK